MFNNTKIRRIKDKEKVSLSFECRCMGKWQNFGFKTSPIFLSVKHCQARYNLVQSSPTVLTSFVGCFRYFDRLHKSPLYIILALNHGSSKEEHTGSS